MGRWHIFRAGSSGRCLNPCDRCIANAGPSRRASEIPGRSKTQDDFFFSGRFVPNKALMGDSLEDVTSFRVFGRRFPQTPLGLVTKRILCGAQWRAVAPQWSTRGRPSGPPQCLTSFPQLTQGANWICIRDRRGSRFAAGTQTAPGNQPSGSWLFALRFLETTWARRTTDLARQAARRPLGSGAPQKRWLR